MLYICELNNTAISVRYEFQNDVHDVPQRCSDKFSLWELLQIEDSRLRKRLFVLKVYNIVYKLYVLTGGPYYETYYSTAVVATTIIEYPYKIVGYIQCNIIIL